MQTPVPVSASLFVLFLPQPWAVSPVLNLLMLGTSHLSSRLCDIPAMAAAAWVSSDPHGVSWASPSFLLPALCPEGPHCRELGALSCSPRLFLIAHKSPTALGHGFTGFASSFYCLFCDCSAKRVNLISASMFWSCQWEAPKGQL